METQQEDDMDRTLARSTTMALTLNDVRILVNALSALVYFGKEDDERYIDEDGIELRTRLQETYARLMKAGSPAE